MTKSTLQKINKSLSSIAMSAIVLGSFGTALAALTPVAFAATAPTTTAATNVTTSDAMMNGMNGDTGASDSSFWASTSPFVPVGGTNPTLPPGVFSTPSLGAQGVNAPYSAQLSSTVNLPAVTPNTTYYFTAWTDVGGVWSPGAVMSFTTVSAPTITTITPSSGTTAGGTSITITGTQFQNGATVTVGGTAATAVTVVSDSSITAMTPAGTAGAQDVVVTNPDAATVTSTGGFTYVTPVANPDAPTTLPATNVTASDATLNSMNGASAAQNASFWVSTSTFSTAAPVLPAGVYSTLGLGAEAANASYSAALTAVQGMPAVTPNTTYYFATWSEVGGTWSPGAILTFTTSAAVSAAPTISSISPTTGTTTSGTTVTITGTGFTGATAVHFGGMLATGVTASTTAMDTSITVTSPATTTAGMVDVTVTTPAGTSATSPADQFTYLAPGSGSIGGTVNATGTLAVTSVTATKTDGTADGTFANGWSYVFNITLPTNESNVAMKFSDWTSGSATMATAGDMRISSAQADNADATILVSAANTYTTPDLHMVTDLDPATAGIQTQVTVEVAIPVGTSNGSYSTNYGVRSE